MTRLLASTRPCPAWPLPARAPARRQADRPVQVGRSLVADHEGG